MAELDLDAYKAARLEATGDEPKRLLFGGEKFDLPPEPPWDFADLLTVGDAGGAMRALLGEDAYTRFRALQPSTLDARAILDHLEDVYPDLPGEGQAASDGSSKPTGGRSRPTSKGSTG